jgi:two-component system phosphate regulon response regulator PhoB
MTLSPIPDPGERPTPARLLVISADRDFVEALRGDLGHEGYAASVVGSIPEIGGTLIRTRPTLVVLGPDLRDVDAADAIRQVRQGSSTLGRLVPVLAASANAKGAGTTAARHMMARIRSSLRHAENTDSEDILSFAGVRLDPAAYRVTRNGRPLHLGPAQFQLLRFLMTYPRRVFSREALLDVVHGVNLEPRTVDVYIRRLRQVLNDDGEPDVIRTVRSRGYGIDDRDLDGSAPPSSSSRRKPGSDRSARSRLSPG